MYRASVRKIQNLKSTGGILGTLICKVVQKNISIFYNCHYNFVTCH